MTLEERASKALFKAEKAGAYQGMLLGGVPTALEPGCYRGEIVLQPDET